MSSHGASLIDMPARRCALFNDRAIEIGVEPGTRRVGGPFAKRGQGSGCRRPRGLCLMSESVHDNVFRISGWRALQHDLETVVQPDTVVIDCDSPDREQPVLLRIEPRSLRVDDDHATIGGRHSLLARCPAKPSAQNLKAALHPG